MFLELAHTKLDVFKISKEFVLVCYKETRSFPSEERFAMIQQIRRAALSVHLNIAEGASRKSVVERKRYYEIARGSVVEIDAAVGIAYKLSYVNLEQLQSVGDLIIKNFKLLTGMIN